MPNQNETDGSVRLSRRALIFGAAATAIGGGLTAFGISEAFRSRPTSAAIGDGGGATPTPTPYGAPPTEARKPPIAPPAKDVCPPNAQGGARPENPFWGDQVTAAVPVPGHFSEIKVTNLGPNVPQGVWLHPIYDEFEADEAHKYRGIGPHHPQAYRTIDANAATFTTHGHPGETIIRAAAGGRVMVAVMQPMVYQNQTKWSSESGKPVQNDAWTNQYTLKGLRAGQEVRIIDPDTGRQFLWEDNRTPVIYPASINGDMSIELPIACGDVRVGMVFQVFAGPNEQPQEVKMERGPNNHPELRGENPLPRAVVRNPIPGQV